jgi:type III pantothenate kinase
MIRFSRQADGAIIGAAHSTTICFLKMGKARRQEPLLEISMDTPNTTILVIDVGNTNTVLGLYQGASLRALWRLATSRDQTADEYGVLIHNLFALEKLPASEISGMMIASVVPPMNSVLAEMAGKYFKMEALFLGPGTRTGMAILVDTPQEVGADRIADAVAAFEKYGGPCIVLDFGTAITFDCISQKGEYLGGVIMPGIGIAADALFQRTAKLPRVEFREPDRVIGTNTISNIQSGLFYGAVDAVDGMLDRLSTVLGKQTKVIATGGQAPLVAGASRYKPTLDSSLTLDGLRIIYHRNQSAPRRK